MEKLRVGGLRARRYEKKIKLDKARKVTKEKEQYEWKDKYERERERYYIRNSFCMGVEEVKNRQIEETEMELIRKGRE